MKFLARKVVSFALAGAMLLGMAPSVLKRSENFDISANAVSAVPEGFVYTKGTQFMMDRNTYYYGGTNCYYLIYKSKTAVDNVLDDCEDMGLNVIRTWGHLDVGRKTNEIGTDGAPIFEGNNDNNGGVASKDGVYFQYWDDKLKKPVVNEGADGLRKLDYVIAEAEKRGIKLIITFTNYWEAFGGMGQYVKYYQMLNGGSPDNNKLDETAVCEFYTNETIKQWYKDYINTLLNHTNYYTGEKLMDSEAVFSWELANEPRCTIDGDANNFCKDDILYNWVTEMSAYVKSIDPYHMVSIGDEGFYNLGYQEANAQKLPSAAYSGYYGVDFEKLMTIDTIDFGTPHMYIDQWGFTDGDDVEWIKRHAETTIKNNKPIIFEEFGVKDKSARDDKYETWLSILTGDYYEGIEYQGFNYWMIASWIDDSQQASYGDGRYYYMDYDQYTVYGPEEVDAKEGSPRARKLLVEAAAKMNEKNINNTVEVNTTTVDRSGKENIVADLYVMVGQFESVTLDGVELTKGTDYTVNGNIITVNEKCFDNVELGKHTVKFMFTEGNCPAVEVSVIDSTVIDATLSTYEMDIDKSPYVVADTSVEVTLNDNEFRGIKYGKTALVEGTDYTWADNKVTFLADYLKALPDGEVTLVFDFYEGNDRQLKLNVSDSSTRLWTGSFNIGNWANTLEVNKNLSEWISGNLKVTLENTGDCQLQLNYIDADGNAKKIVDYTNAFSADEYTFKLSDAEFELLRTAQGFTIKGKGAIIKAVDVVDGRREGDREPIDPIEPDDSSSIVVPDSSSVADSSSTPDDTSSVPDSSSVPDDTSSVPDSSSTTDEEPEGEHLIFNETIKTDSWTTTTLASIDFTGYKYARIELTATSAFNNFILNYGGSDASYYVGVKSLTAELNGSTLAYKTLPKMSELQNKTTTIKADGQANTYTLKVYASKTGETGDSSIVDDSSSTVDPIPTGTPELLQNTFTLDGMIGANFDYSIPRGFVYGNYDIKAIFKSANETLEVAIDTNKTVRVDGTKAYRFTLPVKSCDLTEPFAAKLVIKDAEGEVLAETEVKEFAVNDYLKVMRYCEDANLRKLASALQTYGYYSQQMFNTDAELPVTKPNDVSDVKASTLVDYKGTISVFNGEKKVNLDETTLTVEAETAIRFYIKDLNGFDADELYLSYTVNGNTEKTKVKYSASKDMYYGEIPNIGASKLANMYTAYFVVNDEQVSDSVNYGAYSYIFEVIRYSEDATHKNLARALYKYSLAAQEYQDSLPEEVEGELDTTVTNSTKENFGDYEGTISNVDIDGNKLYSQDDLVSEFGSFGNLYDKDLYNDGCGSDVGIAFCGWNIANYIQDPTLDYKLDYFRDGSEHNVNRMTFIPTYFLDTYEEGIKVGGKNTLTPDEQADIMAQALNMNVRLNYRLHIDPQRFAPDGNSYSKVDTSVPGSQWWRGEFTEIHPMGDDYLAMIDEGFEALEKTMRKIGNKELVEPIRFDIGAELMTSVKNFTSEWIELVDYCRNKIESSSLLRDKVILSYNFCHHIEYLIEIEGHADYFGRINGTGVTYKDRADLLFVDDMTEENKQLLAEFITSLDTFTISQYMPMDIFAPASLTDTNVATTAEDVRDALLTHEQNFLQKVLIGKLGIAPEEIPPFHLGEYGMGIKGLTAPNVWDRTAWTDAELATYKVQQEHAKVALEGLMLYMQDERSVAKSLSLWISGAPYDVINFYPGMNVGDAGHGYPGKAAYNAEAAQVLKDYWNGRF